MLADPKARPVPAVQDRRVPPLPGGAADGARLRRALVVGPGVALVGVVVALAATDAAGLALRDAAHVAARRLLILLGLVALLGVLDVAARAARRSPTRLPSRAAMASVRRERWT